MNYKRQFTLSLLCISLLGTVLTGCGAANNTAVNNAPSATGGTGGTGGKTVTIGWLPWTEDVAVTHVWKVLLEQKGYTVKTPELDVGPLLLGLSKNSVNVFLDLWMPGEKPNVDKYKENLVTLNDWYTGTSSTGIAVPSYVKDVNTPQDLNRHANEFKNRIIGIDPGAIEETNAHKYVKVYKLNNIEVKDSSTPAMLASVERAYKRKQPVAVVMWTPMWAFTKYHLKYLSDPKYIVKSKTNNKILVESNKTWVKNNPKIVAWLKAFKLTPEQLASLEEEMKNTSNKDDAARNWIKNNQSVINGWFQ